jgi:N-acetyl-anhydromuramyl-L-alanine amidase AmpD
MNQVKVINRVLNHENVSGASVVLQASRPARPLQPVSVATNPQGVALLPNNLPDGNYALSITPLQTSTADVGPAIASGAAVPDRIYRSMNLTVLVRGGLIGGIVSGADAGGKASVSGGIVKAELQPVFIKSPNHSNRGHRIDLVVVHHTAGPSLVSAINQFLTSGTTSSHYLIDKDGQIVKMVPDGMAAWHAGVTYWAGQTGLNANSIGIEIVNQDGEGFTEAQYTAALGLIQRLVAAFPHIRPYRVVAHSDIGTNEAGRLGRKSTCPGSLFEWVRVEKAGYGLIPAAGQSGDGVYGGFFKVNPTGTFRTGDRDDQHLFGGKKYSDGSITGAPVLEIQQDLSGIGYSVGTPSGHYDEKTHYAVQMFQEHFFAGGRGGAPTGSVDRTTGDFIKRVLNGPTGED